MAKSFAPTKREPSQIQLLKAVELEIDGRLKQSLHNAVRLSRGMKRQYRAISLPWQAVWYQPGKLPERLPAGLPILDAFYQAKQQLLILGETGSGKTTTMLGLAQDLLERAKADSSQPIPVLVSLSSYNKYFMFNWLVEELRLRYGLRQDLGKAWIQNGTLLPLLDELEEAPLDSQEDFAKSLEYWLRRDENKPCGVVVCCQGEAFRRMKPPLKLQGAIELQALTPEQIEDYFDRFGLPGAWQMVRNDTALQQLLAKPLFLSIFALVQIHGRFDIAEWKARSTIDAKNEYLLDTYWNGMMSRELNLTTRQKTLGWQSRSYQNKPFLKPKTVRKMLVFVAKAMKRDLTVMEIEDFTVKTEFLIENLHPDWLPNKHSKKVLEWVASVIFICFHSAVYSCFFDIAIFVLSGEFIGGGIGQLITLILIFFIVFFIVSFSINLVFKRDISWVNPFRNSIYFDRISCIEQNGIFPISISRHKILTEFKDSIENFCQFGLKNDLKFLAFCLLLILVWVTIVQININYIGILFSGIVSYVYCKTQNIKKTILKFFAAEILIKKYPNHETKRSFFNILILGAIGFILASLILFTFKDSIGDLVLWFTQFGDGDPIDPNTINPTNSELFAIASFITFLTLVHIDSQNVEAFIAHIVLRIVLKFYGYVPIRFDRLLDYCTERLLIQRIGGRYRFTHKLLQDHFAKMELD